MTQPENKKPVVSTAVRGRSWLIATCTPKANIELSCFGTDFKCSIISPTTSDKIKRQFVAKLTKIGGIPADSFQFYLDCELRDDGVYWNGSFITSLPCSK